MKFSASESKNADIDLLDTIIYKIKANLVKADLKEDFSKFLHSFNEYDKEHNIKLINICDSMNNQELTYVSQIELIYKIAELVYWKNWECRMGHHEIKVLTLMDTLSLYENTRYVFPIKTMYNGDLSPLTILSNSLQNGLADEIEFKTTDKSKKYMKVKYTCKAINNITKETKNLHQEFVVRLLKRE